MANLEKVIRYLYEKHPNKSSLSRDRLKFLLYLADWKSAIENKRQITNLSWEIQDGRLLLPRREYEELRIPSSLFSSIKSHFKTLSFFGQDDLTENDVEILDFVISMSREKNWDSLSKLVYSTYPTLGEQEVEYLNLTILADKYKSLRQAFGFPKTGVTNYPG